MHISDEMGGIVSARDWDQPAATTTADTTTTSTPSSTYNTAQNMTCKFDLKKCAHSYAEEIVITLIGHK